MSPPRITARLTSVAGSGAFLRSSARERASSKRWGTTPDAACSPATMVAGSSSRHARKRDRTGNLESCLELLRIAVAGRLPVDDDTQVGPPRVQELPDLQLPDLGAAAPVDVAPVVARRVLPEAVEREIAGRQVLRGQTLEVPEEAGTERLERHGVGMDDQFVGLAPGSLPVEETERVTSERRRRPNRDDPPALGRHDEELFDSLAWAE